MALDSVELSSVKLFDLRTRNTKKTAIALRTQSTTNSKAKIPAFMPLASLESVAPPAQAVQASAERGRLKIKTLKMPDR